MSFLILLSFSADQGTGLVYVYQLVSAQWSYTQTLFMPGSDEEDNNGSNPPDYNNPNMYYYANNIDSNQVDTGYNAYFGTSVSVGNKFAIIGAPGASEL
jgi:hypothetical protein